MGAPIPPAEYDGEHLDTDEKLEEEGWAAGLDIWSVLDKVLGDAVRDGTVANAQLWSLREAVRAEHLAELVAAGQVREPVAPRRRQVTCGRCMRIVGVTEGRLDPHESPLGGSCVGSGTVKCGDPNDCRCTHGCDIP